MAENGSVVIKIKGDDSDFSGKLKGLGGAASTIMKGVAAAGAAAGAAVVALGKSAIESYASYEQLVGGVETLFKDSADTVKQYADNAYKTAGMSANQYMETVTSFSASLLQSLGGDTDEAAKKADKAIVDMSDNANKMGSSMESIQNAYQGFAKQNYTMLDNLKLGYGGTKEEMQRLLSDAEKISGIKYDISSYADIVDAIHVVQEEMGITGTTAEEASSTIEGSVNSMKAAWQNMLVGIADENQDFDVLLENLISSVGTVAENILPRVEVVLSGIAKLVVKLAPTLAETAGNLLMSLGQFLVEKTPVMLQRVPEVVLKLSNAVQQNGPKLITAAGHLIAQLATGIIKSIPTLVASAPKVIKSFADGLRALSSALISAGKEIINGIITGIKEALPNVGAAAASAKDFIVNKFKGVFKINSPSKVMRDTVGKSIGEGIAVGIEESTGEAVEAAEEMSEAIVDTMAETETAVDQVRRTAVKVGEVLKSELAKQNAALEAMQKAEDEKQAKAELEEYKKKLAEKHAELNKAEKKNKQKLQKEIAEIEADWQKKQAKAAKDAEQQALKDRISILKDFQQEYEKSLSEIERKQDSLNSKLSDYGDLFKRLKDEDGKEIFKLGDLENDVKAIEKFGETIDKLKERGISGGLLEEIAGMNMTDASEFSAKLASLSDSNFEKYVAAYEEKQRAANEVSKKFYAEEMDALEESTIKQMEGFSEDFVEVGELLTAGVADGIENGEESLKESVKKTISAAVEAAKEELSGDSAGKLANAYNKVKSAMDNSMSEFSSDVSVQAKGATTYITNTTNIEEGDINVNVEKIVNDGKGTAEGMLEEFEFIRRKKSAARGGV